MTRLTPTRRATAVAALTAVVTATLAGTAAPARAQQTLNGAGATFPQPLYLRWFQQFGAKTGTSINYQGVGSGAGIKQVTARTVDFGASDAPMNAQELAAAPGILHIPTVAGAVVLAYNVPGAPQNLKLTPDVIADIFLGKLTKWNDARIASANPGARLPALNIAPFHRADGSGTTNAFTSYLSAVSPEWKTRVGAGKSVRWTKGLAGKGNPGVAALVKQTPGGIGYVELNYAVENKIPYAAVRNAKGKFIVPSVASTTAAAAGAAASLPVDLRSVIVNTPAPNGYPITSFTYVLVYPNAKPQVKQLLQWALTTGQKDAPAMTYAPLPPAVQKKALAAVAKIK